MTSLHLVQIPVIIAVARATGCLFEKFGQPRVAGEMVAGIMLGPSLLGWLAPGLSAALFSPASLPLLNSFSQIGLVMFLFLVGLENDPAQLRGHREAVVLTSHASITLPFFLGVLLAMALYPHFADSSVTFMQFALFMGVSMSITALAVLARVLEEQGLRNTPIGAIAIVCAAVDDATGWLVIALVLLLTQGQTGHLPMWLTLICTAAYLGAMLGLVPKGLRWLWARYQEKGNGEVNGNVLACALLLTFASASLTEYLSLHPLFGGFVAGLVMPRDPTLLRALRAKIQDITLVLLLPLFFALSGLRTQLGMLNDLESWLFFGAILGVAVVGKFGGASFAAHATGLRWRHAAEIGVLVNSRGLMELVVLNIGADIGVVSPRLFTTAVLMAIVTTLMAPPILRRLHRHHAQEREAAPAPSS